ncbi:MAG: TetR/AcrR family transcriptional regulator [Bacteroidia bacterium]|nr:TetR/AcrR family transcriptional regulator [Bacteroidia bacterium]
MKPKAEKKRQQIIDAARNCIAQFGYDRTTLDDIGLKMSLNKSSLYYYFKNKEEIYTEVVYQEADRVIEELQSEISNLENAEERIQFYMKKRLVYYRRILSLHKLSAESLRQIQPGFHDLYDNILKREIEFIHTQLKEMISNIDDKTLKNVAALIISSADGIKHDEIIYNKQDTYEEPDYARIEQETRLLIKLILLGLNCINTNKPEHASVLLAH